MIKKAEVTKLLIITLISSLLIIALLFTYATYSYYRTVDTLSDTVTATVRTEILSGDFRNAITHLNIPIGNVFYKITYISLEKGKIFDLNQNGHTDKYLLSSLIKKNIYTDDQSKFYVGTINYYFDYNEILATYTIIACIMLSITLFIYFLGKKKIEKDFKIQLQLKKNEQLSTLSTQVAHDIRSPLSALGSIFQNLEKINPEQQSLIRHAVERINGIADGLLSVARTGEYATLSMAQTDLAILTKQIVEEKKVLFANNKSLTIDLNILAPVASISTDPKELERILSNLINNSAEAMPKGGTISISLSRTESQQIISIEDQGSGIPQKVLNRIGEKGISDGKEKGNGLGLYHAYHRMKDFGGEMQILSSTSSGTIINLLFPIETNIRPEKEVELALIDNDPLVRMNWSISAKKRGLCFTAYASSSEFLSSMHTLSKNTPIYIDDDLNEDRSGSQFAHELHELHLFTNIHLCTGHSSDKFKHLTFLKSIINKSFPTIFDNQK